MPFWTDMQDKSNSILRTGASALVLLLLTYGGLLLVALLSSDLRGLAKAGQMLAFAVLPGLASLGVVLFLAARASARWSVLRVWLVYSPFLILSLCSGFVFAVRLGSPYTAPEIFENKIRCYAVSHPAGAIIDQVNPGHVSFQTAEWSGAIQFIPGQASPAKYVAQFQMQMKQENATAQFDGDPERLTVDGQEAIRLQSRTTVNGQVVHTLSVFLSGRKNDLVHIYSILPAAPIRDAQEFARYWPESFVWKDACNY